MSNRAWIEVREDGVHHTKVGDYPLADGYYLVEGLAQETCRFWNRVKRPVLHTVVAIMVAEASTR